MAISATNLIEEQEKLEAENARLKAENERLIEKYETHDHAPCIYCDPLRAENASLKSELAKKDRTIIAVNEQYKEVRDDAASLKAQLAEVCETVQAMREEWQDERKALQEQLATKERELANYTACQIGQVPKA